MLQKPMIRALIALVFILIIGAVFNADGAFFNWDTHRDMLRHISVFGILACGMTLVIITAGIDLSVGSLLGFTAVLFSLFTIQLGWSPLLPILVCLAAGAACGMISGGLISKFQDSALHRHPGHDGFCPGTGQMGIRRPESVHGRPAGRRQLSVRGSPAYF